MTVRALLSAPAAGDPGLHVAGLTVLLRQLLSLQDAGVEEVAVEGMGAAGIPQDPRLRLRVVPAEPGRIGGSDGGFRLRARAGLVWHRLLPRRLLAQGYTGDIESAPLLPGEFVLPVTDDRTRRRAEQQLLGSLLKGTDGLVSRTINRPVSLQVTRGLLESRVTPNHMTVIAAFFGFAAIAVVAAGGMRWLVPGAVLLQVQSILDGCDGEISRLKYIRTRLGEWLDQVLDDVVNLGFFLAAGWALYRHGSTWALPVTVAGGALHLVYQVSLYAALVCRGGGSGSVTSIRWWGQNDHSHLAPGAAPGFARRFKETVENAGRRDFFTFLYLPAALFGVVEVALAWSAIIFAVSGLTTGLQWVLRGGPEPATPKPAG
jgi:phosphatidylglycerophosphate synthase